jgi:hypothetical protein
MELARVVIYDERFVTISSVKSAFGSLRCKDSVYENCNVVLP